MSVAFADSSAIVKLYADETGADSVREVPTFLVSHLARVEVPAALWKKHRVGDLPAGDTRVLVAEFEADYFGAQEGDQRLIVIEVTAGVLDDAARLAGVHGLRAYDGVQLATAMAARSALDEELTFLAFDQDLNTAAAVEGLHVT